MLSGIGKVFINFICPNDVRVLFKAETALSQNRSSDGPWGVLKLRISILVNEQIADPSFNSTQS